MENLYNWSEKLILIADDDIINYELLNLILRPTKAKLVHLKNGQLVLDYINTEQAADLILMDIQMPVLDGLKATEQLRSDEYTGTIFALTALNTSVNHQQYMDTGFNEVIEKPVRREAFLKLIGQYLDL